MFSRILGAALWGVLAWWFLSPVAAATEIRYDPNLYAPLAPVDSAETIAPGTRITLQNWQQYRHFMPFGMQVLYSGKYLWHVGSGSEYTLTVGPTIRTPLIKQFVRDTEKYAGQAKLEKVDSGGYRLTGYVAGLPFPNPTEPELATKALFNAYYVYYFTVEQEDWNQFFVDRFLNVSRETGGSVEWRLSHLSARGKPVNPPYGIGYLRSTRTTVKSPEQLNYLTVLNLVPDDPGATDEQWIFAPFWRRSLRQSTASRCANLYPTDTTQDEGGEVLFALQVPNFKVTFLGERKLLFMEHSSTDRAISFNPNSVLMKGSLPGWPKPVMGQWELRDVYVLDIEPLPVMGHFCYAHKIYYIDRETWLPDGVEMYDGDSKLWKVAILTRTMGADNDGEGEAVPYGCSFALMDLQQSHVTIVVTRDAEINNDVPVEMQDPEDLAFPGSLPNLMK